MGQTFACAMETLVSKGASYRSIRKNQCFGYDFAREQNPAIVFSDVIADRRFLPAAVSPSSRTNKSITRQIHFCRPETSRRALRLETTRRHLRRKIWIHFHSGARRTLVLARPAMGTLDESRSRWNVLGLRNRRTKGGYVGQAQCCG